MSAPDTLPSKAAPAAPPRPGGSWLAEQGRLPLAFMGLGLAWFVASAAATALAPALLATPHIAPAVIAVTHMWVLGFFVTIAVGAIYQLAPVALSTTLWSERLAWRQFALHAISVPVMIYAFWRWDLFLLGSAGSLVVAGIATFAVNTWMTVARSGKRDAVAWSLVFAAGWLLLTVAAGVTLVANRLWAFWPGDPLPLLRSHAHLGLVGFFITLLQGVSFRLVPMFTLGDVPDWRPVRFGLWCSQLGLAALAPGLAWHVGWLSAISGAAIVVGMIASAWALWRTLGTRKKRALDVGMQALLRGSIVLFIAGCGAVWLVAPVSSAGSAPGGYSANVYGVLVILGGLLPAIAGMMNKIVPFLTWMRAYGPRVGRGPTPPATALSNPRLERASLAVQALAIVPLLVGAWTLHVPWLQAGAWLLLLSTIGYTANMVLVFRHLWRPVQLTAPTPLRRPS